jgi:hypothetical protein
VAFEACVHAGLHGFDAKIIAAQAVDVVADIVDVFANTQQLPRVIGQYRLCLSLSSLQLFQYLIMSSLVISAISRVAQVKPCLYPAHAAFQSIHAVGYQRHIGMNNAKTLIQRGQSRLDCRHVFTDESDLGLNRL